MPCGFDTFVIRHPGVGGGGGLGWDMMGMLDGKLEETKQGVGHALNMGTNFGFPSQGGPRRPLPCFFFLRNVALFFNIVYLAGTLPPSPLSEVCVCPCNRL